VSLGPTDRGGVPDCCAGLLAPAVSVGTRPSEIHHKSVKLRSVSQKRTAAEEAVVPKILTRRPAERILCTPCRAVPVEGRRLPPPWGNLWRGLSTRRNPHRTSLRSSLKQNPQSSLVPAEIGTSVLVFCSIAVGNIQSIDTSSRGPRGPFAPPPSEAPGYSPAL
jgi:hypothetical protein